MAEKRIKIWPSPRINYRLYRGSMKIVTIHRSNIVKVRYLTTNKVSSVHNRRLQISRHQNVQRRAQGSVVSGLGLVLRRDDCYT